MPRRRWIPIVGFVVVGGALIAGLISISIGEQGPNTFRVQGSGEAQRLFGGLEQRENDVGAVGAPVTISVFNDLQCLECADFHFETVPALVEDIVRPGDARLALRHFSQSRKPTQISALASTAAGEQGAQWQYAHIFLSNLDQIPEIGITQEFLATLAAAIPGPEFNVPAWEEDFGGDEVQARVFSDAELATDLRLPAGPAVVVDGPGGTVELVQSPSVAEIAAAVDEVSE
ncbi:MAG: DsbA family protein [Solirubrobacterales bacterium]